MIWGEGFSYWVWRVPLQGSHISHQLKGVKGCVIVPRRVYKGFFPPGFPVFAWWFLSLSQLNKCRMKGACLPLESRKHQAAVIFYWKSSEGCYIPVRIHGTIVHLPTNLPFKNQPFMYDPMMIPCMVAHAWYLATWTQVLNHLTAESTRNLSSW